ncbi:MAG: helix-turn-helix transcriptional regulator [Lachnospiraceae bacterium]|nr:helix-turn-helix transcriptional regulator [Lachnospiraceae bacterium]
MNMNTALSENIKKYRKQNHLTQEQLAEVMGVTTGAVHKWESAMSIPELDMILKLADFFEVSVDLLVGYQKRDNTLKSMMERIGKLAKAKDPEALLEMEKALKKYPDSFWLVYYCASIYTFYGIGNKNNAESRRALELYEQSLGLIRQNEDPRISEETVRGEMAKVYYTLGEYEKSLEISKKYNPSGMYDDFIGTVLAKDLKRMDEAEPYILNSMMNGIAKVLTSIMGYVLILFNSKEYKKAGELLKAGLDLMSDMHMGTEADIAYKVIAVYNVLYAHVKLKTGETKEARALIESAAAMSAEFDDVPNYGIRNFIIDLSERVIVYDLLLEGTAKASVEKILKLIGNKELSRLWKGASDR